MGQNGQQVVYDPYTGRYVYQQVPPRGSFQQFANGNQPQQHPSLSCRFVDDPNKIMPSEVPTNGDPACFIMNDYSVVYLKAINSSGTIDTVPYTPMRQEKPEDVQKRQFDEFQQSVFAKFAQLETMISQIAAQHTQPQQQPARENNRRQDGGNRNA